MDQESQPGGRGSVVSYADLLSIFERAPVGIAVVDLEGRFLTANAWYAAVVRRPVEDLLTLRFHDLTHAEDLGEDVREFERLKAGEIQAYTLEKRFVDLRGGWFWVQVHSSLLPLSGGGVGALRIVQDVTERRRAEESLREAESRKSAILSSALDCIISMDRRGTIVDFNPAAERVFGWAASEVVGRHLADVIIPERLREQHWRGLERFLATGAGPLVGRRVEVPGLRRDGSEFPCELAINVIWVGGEPFFTAYLRDISERIVAQTAMSRYAQQMEAQAAELARANADLEDLTAMAAHDLKEPLRGIGTGVEFLAELLGPDAPPDVKERIASITRLVRRAYSQLDGIMSYTRMGREGLRIEPVAMAKLGREAAEQLEALRQETGGTIEVDPGLPEVSCDPTLVRQVLANLFANALKYNRAERKLVRLSLCGGEGAPVFCVADNGIGIPEKHRETVFRMFKRLNPGAGLLAGTGVGLPLARRIVERHGGRMWVESAPEGGTLVLFTLGPGAPIA